ncbi:MAG: hypothetical protein M1826_002749 [Phylliscum demangeonii]|nr:MAG: hypothetical protein M1826_002749 [Phylliscum demangeonii]
MGRKSVWRALADAVRKWGEGLKEKDLPGTARSNVVATVDLRIDVHQDSTNPTRARGQNPANSQATDRSVKKCIPPPSPERHVRWSRDTELKDVIARAYVRLDQFHDIPAEALRAGVQAPRMVFPGVRALTETAAARFHERAHPTQPEATAPRTRLDLLHGPLWDDEGRRTTDFSALDLLDPAQPDDVIATPPGLRGELRLVAHGEDVLNANAVAMWDACLGAWRV